MAAFVSPYIKDRDNIKTIVNDSNYVEVYVNTSIDECIRRDTKGLYKKALSGEIKNMTGVSAPYEAPVSPDIEIKTEEMTIDDAVELIIEHIDGKLFEK